MSKRERTLGFAVKALSNQLKRMYDKSAIQDNEAGLTGMQFAVLGFIADTSCHRDVFQRDIEEKFDIRRSTATSILQLMEKNGILRRESVPGDLRLKRIRITERGYAVHERQGKRMERTEAMLVEGVDPADLAAFYRVMAIASANIQRHLGEAGEDEQGGGRGSAPLLMPGDSN